MSKEDIRWQQRFKNFKNAFLQLDSGAKLAQERKLSLLEQQGLIQAFEFTHELAWNVMKDFANFQGNTAIAGSRDATREAFKMQLINDGEIWMEMIKSRNQTTHTYNKNVADDIVKQILKEYYQAFEFFQKTMENLCQ